VYHALPTPMGFALEWGSISSSQGKNDSKPEKFENTGVCVCVHMRAHTSESERDTKLL